MRTPEILIDRAEALKEIKMARQKLHDAGMVNCSVFCGINNKGLLQDGTRIPDEPLLRCFNEAEWQRELAIYHKANLKVKCIESFKDEITQAVAIPELDIDPLQIRYFGIEVQDGVLPMDHPALEMDPRAPLLAQMLTGTQVAWPFLYVYAQVQSIVSTVDECSYSSAKSNEAMSRDEAVRVLAAGLLRDWTMEGDDDSVEKRADLPNIDVTDAIADGEPAWAAPGAQAGQGTSACAFPVAAEHWDTGSPDPTRRPPAIVDVHTAERLQIDAKQAVQAGDHKTAYLLMEKAIALMGANGAGDVPTAHETEYAPMNEQTSFSPPSGQSAEPRSFRPATTYNLANGSVHVVPAGLYTENEWFTRTIEAQEMVDKEIRAQREQAHAGMSKYADPLTRSDSQCESMVGAESLGTTIKHKAERARTVMEASMSKEASPTLSPAPAPDLPHESELVKLGESLADVKIGNGNKEQIAAWDAAGDKLREQASALWRV